MDFKLKYQIQADGRQAKAELSDVEKAIDRMSKRAASSASGGGIGAVFGGSLAADAFSRIQASASDAGTAVFDFTSRIQQSHIAFTTLSGSAGTATKHLADLRKLATQTPLALQSLTSMSQRLQGAGVQLERIVPLIKEIGNTAAATGELTAERMEGISLAFSQVITKGKVSAEEMNQLAERGIPAWRILSEQLGWSAAELQKMAKDGEISADVLLKAFEDFSRANFGNAMQKQAQTFTGAMSIISNIALDTAGTAFQPIYDEISKFSAKIAQSLQNQKEDVTRQGVSFGFAIGEAIGQGIEQSKIGDKGWFVGVINALYTIPYLGTMAADFGRQMGEGIAKGFQDAADPFNKEVAGFQREEDAFNAQLARYNREMNRLRALQAGKPSSGFEPIGTKPAKGRAVKDDSQRRAEEAERERIRLARQLYEDQTAYFSAEARKRFAVVQEYAEAEKRSAADVARFQEFLALDTLEFKKAKLDEYIKKLVPGTNEYGRALHEQSLLELDIETLRSENAKNEADRKKASTEAERKLHDERKQRWKEHIDFLIKRRDLEDAEIERAAAERAAIARQNAEAAMATAPGTLYGGIMSGLGGELVPMFDAATNAMLTFQQRLQMVHQDINTFVGDALGGMVNGLIQMGVAWLTTGEFSAKAALQMLSSVAFSIATQAAIKAVFEAAESVAAFARWDPVSGAMHASAATMYSSVAVIAGAAGIGLALGARAMGGGSGSASGSANDSSSSYGGSSRPDQSPDPFSRVSDNAFVSGRDREIVVLARAVDKLSGRLDSMPPGEVVVSGLRQKRGIVGRQLVEDVKSNAGVGVALGKRMGIR